MIKNDLIKEVSKLMKGNKISIEIVNMIFSTISESLMKGESVSIKGLGTFKVTTRKARRGINPHTGEAIQIAEKKVVKFIPSQALREMVQ